MAEINSFISSSAQKEVVKYEKQIANLTVLYGKMADSAKELEGQQKKQSNTQKELDNQTKAYNQLLNQLNNTSGKLAVAESGLNKELIRQKQQVAENNKELKESIKLEKTEAGSIARLQAANKKLRQERNALSTETEYGRQRINELNHEIEENTKVINENSTAQEQARDNVGNYEESIRSALDAQDAFSGGTTNVINNFISLSQQEGGLKSFFKAGVSGFGAMTKAALKFILTPVGAIIAALVVGITLLTKAVSRNQGFMDKFTEVMSGLSAVLDNVVGRVFKLVAAFAKLGISAVTGDLEGMKEAAIDAGKAVSGIGTSIKEAFAEGQAIELLRQDLRKLTIETTTATAKLREEAELLEGIADDSTRSFKEREDAAEKARAKNLELFNTEVELARKREEIIVRENKLAKENGDLTDDLRQQQADATAERIAAEGQLLKVQQDNEKTRRELIQDRLERDLDILIDGFDNVKSINERIIADERKTLEERKDLFDKTVQLSEDSFNKQIETIRKFTDVQFNENELLAEQDAVLLNQKIRNLGLSEIIEGRLLEIIRDRRTATQDLYETERDLESARIKAESDKAKQYSKTIDEQIAKDDEAFEAEQERLDAEVDAEIERQLIRDENAVAEDLKKKERGQKNLSNLAELTGKETELNKASAIKQAIIDGKAAVQSAFSDTPGPLPIKIAAAAIAGGIALKNVNDIISTSTAIPAFAEGTDSTPTNYIAGEAGRELRIDKNGNATMVNSATLFQNDAGSTIFSNHDTERIMRGDMPTKHSLDTERIVGAIERSQSSMNVALDKYGIITVGRKGASKTKVINRKFRNKA